MHKMIYIKFDSGVRIKQKDLINGPARLTEETQVISSSIPKVRQTLIEFQEETGIGFDFSANHHNRFVVIFAGREDRLALQAELADRLSKIHFAPSVD